MKKLRFFYYIQNLLWGGSVAALLLCFIDSFYIQKPGCHR